MRYHHLSIGLVIVEMIQDKYTCRGIFTYINNKYMEEFLIMPSVSDGI